MASETVSQEVLRALPPELYPKVDHLVTEDDTPVDNIFSEKQQRLLVEPLYSSWAGPGDQRRFIALANVGLFFAIRQPPQVPDVLLSLEVELPENLWPKSHRSYFVWEYGKPPEVVVEVVSNREGGEDTEKKQRYARIGVRYYVIFDPEQHLSQEVVRAFQLEALDYRRLDEPLWFPGVELGLRLWQGRYEDHDNTWLRWVDATGQVIPTGAERAEQERQRAEHEHQRAEQERQRAEHEHQRAEQERQRAEHEHQRAEQERQRAERLAEQLRHLGIQPQ
jgi:Uma2 family endonuclease